MSDNYTQSLIRTVLDNSAADDWQSAVHEWYVDSCEEDDSVSGVCVCGKEGLRYLFTIRNEMTGAVLYPIGSTCIKKFERSDLDEETQCWQQAFVLMNEAARLGKRELVRIDSGFYSRKLLYFMYEQDVFQPSRYNDYEPYNDYLFLLDAFNGKAMNEKQMRKCDAIIRYSVYPWLRELWKKSHRAGSSRSGQ